MISAWSASLARISPSISPKSSGLLLVPSTEEGVLDNADKRRSYVLTFDSLSYQFTLPGGQVCGLGTSLLTLTFVCLPSLLSRALKALVSTPDIIDGGFPSSVSLCLLKNTNRSLHVPSHIPRHTTRKHFARLHAAYRLDLCT